MCFVCVSLCVLVRVFLCVSNVLVRLVCDELCGVVWLVFVCLLLVCVLVCVCLMGALFVVACVMVYGESCVFACVWCCMCLCVLFV